MKAIAQAGYGAVPEAVLRVAEIPEPTFGDDEVLVRVGAASVDMGTWSLGADHVIDYTRHDFANGQVRYDVIVDTGGNRRLWHFREALTRRGTLIIVGGETGGRWLGGFERSLRAVLVSPLVRQRLGMLASTENANDLNTLRELIEAGQISSAIDRVFSLSEVPEAISELRNGRARGKFVIAI